MRLLFVKTTLTWPRVSGHDVHTYYSLKACGELGHVVALATSVEPVPSAVAGLRLAAWFSLGEADLTSDARPPRTWLQERFSSFWGVSTGQIAALQRAVAGFRPDAVIVVGLDALPYLPALAATTRVWYAADEWMRHHLSQWRLADRRSWDHLRSAAIKGLYERAHRTVVDRVWVASDSESRAMRWLAGMPHVDVVPNGVDGDYFRPGEERPEPRSAVFWGRLDFGPNVQALEWFCGRVWPLVRHAAPDARFTIVGFNPTDDVLRLGAQDGVSVVQDLPDLRPLVRSHQLAVFPFVSGGGIKNKLLEAAALAMPIVCTPLATQGIKRAAEAMFDVSSDPGLLSGALIRLWRDAAERRRRGAAAREWVTRHHTWTAAIDPALAVLAHRANGAAA